MVEKLIKIPRSQGFLIHKPNERLISPCILFYCTNTHASFILIKTYSSNMFENYESKREIWSSVTSTLPFHFDVMRKQYKNIKFHFNMNVSDSTF